MEPAIERLKKCMGCGVYFNEGDEFWEVTLGSGKRNLLGLMCDPCKRADEGEGEDD